MLCSPILPYQISVLFDLIGEAGIHAYNHSIRGFDMSKDKFKDVAHLLGRVTRSSACQELEGKARLGGLAYSVTNLFELAHWDFPFELAMRVRMPHCSCQQ